MTKPSGVPAVEVAPELEQPLKDFARALGQSPARIVNLARKTSGNTSSYIEMTLREELHDVF